MENSNYFSIEPTTQDTYVLKFKDNPIAFFDTTLKFFLMPDEIKKSFLQEFGDGHNICT